MKNWHDCVVFSNKSAESKICTRLNWRRVSNDQRIEVDKFKQKFTNIKVQNSSNEKKKEWNWRITRKFVAGLLEVHWMRLQVWLEGVDFRETWDPKLSCLKEFILQTAIIEKRDLRLRKTTFLSLYSKHFNHFFELLMELEHCVRGIFTGSGKHLAYICNRWFVTPCDWSLVLIGYVRVEIGTSALSKWNWRGYTRFHIQSN